MSTKKHVEFRYYDIPQGDLVFPLTGETWNKEYGEGKDKLHFHNYYEVGRCYAGEGEMILGDKEYPFYPGCVSLIPTKELHTTNTFGKTAGWEWMYFDIHEVLKKIYPNDDILRENIGHELDKAGRLLTPEMNIQKMTFFIRSIISEMQNKEYMYRDMVDHFLLMLACTAVAAIGMSPLQGDMNALIATCSEYTFLTHGKRVDGTMYSCTSLGTKLGGGIGTALAGWLLALSGYVGGAAEQTASTMNMLHIMYLWMPMIFNLLITLILTRLNVEKANEELRKHK